MNKRVLNRVLIVSVIFIWSLIGYKFLFGFSSSDTDVGITMETTLTVPEKNAGEYENFSLPFIARDPFLGTYFYKKPSQKAVVQSRAPIKKSVEKPWPQIEYFGFIHSENNKHPLVLLKINNQLFRVNEGEINDVLILHKVYNDSIIIIKNREKKTFLKNIQI